MFPDCISITQTVFVFYIASLPVLYFVLFSHMDTAPLRRKGMRGTG